MDLEVGAILTGKVTGITKFGAFVTFPSGKSGLVHISEIANSYVNDVKDFLADGQEVTVKVIGIDGNGRINLSIKQAQKQPEQPRRQQTQPGRQQEQPRRQFAPAAAGREQFQRQEMNPPGDSSFEDKLKRFMQDSDSKISSLKQYNDKRTNRRRGR